MRTILFDVDDTLIVTPSIFEIKRGTESRVITTAGFRDMKNRGATEGWEIDFSSFQDPVKVRQSIMNGEPGPAIKQGLLSLALHELAGPDLVVGILTNRSGDEKFLASVLKEFLWFKAGIIWDINPARVICTNHPKYGLSESHNGSQQKLLFIQGLLTVGYDNILLIDDDKRHVDLINDWRAKHQVEHVGVYHVHA